MIHLIDRNNKINQIFAFQKKVQFIKQVKPNFLITIGHDTEEGSKQKEKKIFSK